MANLKLKLEGSTPGALESRSIILVGSGALLSLQAGDNSNSPIQLTGLKQSAITDADSPYTATIVAPRNIILADASSGAITVNLPPAADWDGLLITVKKLDASNNVTIDGDGAETIDGSTTLVLSTQYDSVTLLSDGTDIHVMSTN